MQNVQNLLDEAVNIDNEKVQKKIIETSEVPEAKGDNNS